MEANEAVTVVNIVTSRPAPQRPVILAELSTRRTAGEGPTSIAITVRGDASPRAIRGAVHLLAAMLETSIDVATAEPDWAVSVSTTSNTVRLDCIPDAQVAIAKALAEEVTRQTALVDDVQHALSWRV